MKFSTLCLAWLTAFVSSGDAAFECTNGTTIDTDVDDNVKVPANETCLIGENAVVKNVVVEEGASLTVTAGGDNCTTVDGYIKCDKCAMLEVSGGGYASPNCTYVTVNGEIEAKDAVGGPIKIDHADVLGDIKVTECNVSSIEVVDNLIPDDKDVQVKKNTVLISLNVARNGDAKYIRFDENTFNGDLTCEYFNSQPSAMPSGEPSGVPSEEPSAGPCTGEPFGILCSPEGDICDGSGSCHNPCLEQASGDECGQGWICNDSLCLPAPCGVFPGVACGSGQVCDASDACIDNPCLAEPYLEPCSLFGGPPPPQFCTGSGFCFLDICLILDQNAPALLATCGEGMMCIEGGCAPTNCATLPDYTPCGTNEICISQSCVAFVGSCIGAPPGIPCSASGDICDGGGNCTSSSTFCSAAGLGEQCGSPYAICDGAGGCLPNICAPVGLPLAAPGIPCGPDEVCDGNGVCMPNPCGEAPFGDPCIGYTMCDGAGGCVINPCFFAPPGFVCGPDGRVCNEEGACGENTCDDGLGIAQFGVPCVSGSTMCDGAGACVPNPCVAAPAGLLCGPNLEVCDGAGGCASPE